MKSKDIIILQKSQQIDEACDMFDNNFETFESNSVFQNACCMCIMQIGELCKLISDELRKEENKIPWKEWCGVRDIFAHQYSNINFQMTWNTIRVDVPILRAECERILDSSREV